MYCQLDQVEIDNLTMSQQLRLCKQGRIGAGASARYRWPGNATGLRSSSAAIRGEVPATVIRGLADTRMKANCVSGQLAHCPAATRRNQPDALACCACCGQASASSRLASSSQAARPLLPSMTAFLLDSHVMLWALAQPERLSARARGLIEDEQSDLHFSVASLWEIVIKLSIGKLELPADWFEQLQARLSGWGVRWLAISPDHCKRVATLPFHDKDPFDRMLVAQSQIESLVLISAEVVIDSYGVQRAW